MKLVLTKIFLGLFMFVHAVFMYRFKGCMDKKVKIINNKGNYSFYRDILKKQFARQASFFEDMLEDIILQIADDKKSLAYAKSKYEYIQIQHQRYLDRFEPKCDDGEQTVP